MINADTVNDVFAQLIDPVEQAGEDAIKEMLIKHKNEMLNGKYDIDRFTAEMSTVFPIKDAVNMYRNTVIAIADNDITAAYKAMGFSDEAIE